MASDSLPLLSIVVASRNDDDSGRLIGRTRSFCRGLFEQCDRHRLDAEILLVDWNTPPGRATLDEALELEEKSEFCAVRVIIVPPALHERFRHSEELPFLQMIAKNVGIRRARGRFVLATNVDVLFSEEMIRFFASGRLRERRMYRADRYDVPAELPDDLPVLEQLDYCKDNVIRVNGYGKTRPASGDAPGTRERARDLRDRARRRVRREGRLLHTNACGDFTLMARRDWFDVRAYAEWPVRAFKIDGLLCYAAHFSGIREAVLKDPLRIYHVEHAARSDGAIVAIEQRATGVTRSSPGQINESGTPRIDDGQLEVTADQYRAWTETMRKERRPLIFNPDEDWGLAKETLKESVLGSGRLSLK